MINFLFGFGAASVLASVMLLLLRRWVRERLVRLEKQAYPPVVIQQRPSEEIQEVARQAMREAYDAAHTGRRVRTAILQSTADILTPIDGADESLGLMEYSGSGWHMESMHASPAPEHDRIQDHVTLSRLRPQLSGRSPLAPLILDGERYVER